MATHAHSMGAKRPHAFLTPDQSIFHVWLITLGMAVLTIPMIG